ncbi:MAG: glycosyl hydrolase 53 family protein [Paludibacteraceae bacterium]|nr:glycosyl hydrolase 53 family protein [Paludibacteraceae bacterium]
MNQFKFFALRLPAGVLFLLVLAFSACTPKEDYTPDPVGSYIRGADCSWLTEQEADGVLFRDSLGREVECMRLMRSYGANAIRLRVWVNHATGWCNLPDVLLKARRAHDLGLRLMIDFHYSDYFCDPGTQTTPADWQSYSLSQLRDAVAAHTTEVLSALRAEDITPEWIQVGNETRNGMLWPVGQLWDTNGDLPNGWANYASLQRAGYDAAKAVFPEAQIVVHLDNAYEDNRWFFRRLKQAGGKWDIIGLSHYPMKSEWSGKSSTEMNRLAAQQMVALHTEFQCPVMLAEIGTLGAPQYEAQAEQVIDELLTKMQTYSWFCGAFYWEPQVYAGWRPKEYLSVGWSAYDMGAFTTTGTPNAALRRLWAR